MLSWKEPLSPRKLGPSLCFPPALLQYFIVIPWPAVTPVSFSNLAKPLAIEGQIRLLNRPLAKFEIQNPKVMTHDDHPTLKISRSCQVCFRILLFKSTMWLLTTRPRCFILGTSVAMWDMMGDGEHGGHGGAWNDSTVLLSHHDVDKRKATQKWIQQALYHMAVARCISDTTNPFIVEKVDCVPSFARKRNIC